MNAKSLSAATLLFTFVMTACSPAASPTQIAAATQAAGQPPVATWPPVPLPTPLPQPGSVPTPVDNFFQNYGVNPYVDAAEDHLSTFALDVDTASYAVARQYVLDGNLPPADAIRVEEFINYFRQDYPLPANVAFGLYADGAPSPFAGDQGTYLLRFGVQGYDVPESQRKPATLTFVIDISGSMNQDNRLGLVKRSLELLVERLRPDDTAAIVIFGSDAQLLLNPTSGEDRWAISKAINSLHTEGATNAEAGLRLGYSVAAQAYRPNAINRVILCSDGVANVGVTGPDAILESIRGYADRGITLTTVGFGMGNFNDVLMEQLADKGDGNYAYVDDIDEAQRLFVDDLTATLQVIALDAKVQVDFNPDVVGRYRLVGYENRAVADESFRNDTIDAGEIGAGHTATALYEVHFKPGAQGRIATVQMRWEDPQAHTVQEINGNFNTWDLALAFEGASPHFQLAVVVMQYAEVLRHSPWAANISLGMLRQYGSRLAEALPGDAEVQEFAGLVSRAAAIAGE